MTTIGRYRDIIEDELKDSENMASSLENDDELAGDSKKDKKNQKKFKFGLKKRL